MKKLSTLLFAVLLIFAQKTVAQEGRLAAAKTYAVPDPVGKSFQAKYPDAKDTEWNPSGEIGGYQATFKLHGRDKQAHFGYDGNWVKTRMPVVREQLPFPVNREITRGEFGSWSISDFAELETAAGKKYEMYVRKGSEAYLLTYDPAGKLLQKAGVSSEAAAAEKDAEQAGD